MASLPYFRGGRLLPALSLAFEKFPFDEDALFGLSPAPDVRLDDLPDWSLRLPPGLLNTIVFNLALSQREGSKLAFFKG